jgi:hypothetical protein
VGVRRLALLKVIDKAPDLAFISAGARQALHKTGPNWVNCCGDNDWNLARHLLQDK